jgi:hypothetical protein
MTSIAQAGGGAQNDQTSPAVVSVSSVNAANETDAISLVAVPEPALAWLLAPVIPVVVGWSRQRRRDTFNASLLIEPFTE